MAERRFARRYCLDIEPCSYRKLEFQYLDRISHGIAREKKEGDFDAVEMMHRAQQEISKRTAGMTVQEEVAYWRERHEAHMRDRSTAKSTRTRATTRAAKPASTTKTRRKPSEVA